MKHHKKLLVHLFLILGISACSSPKQLGNPQAPYPLVAPPEVGQIMHMPTGILVSMEQMLEVATDNRIVYVGETHDNPASHRLQLTILKAMSERYPDKIALGMEMFTPDQNEALTGWIKGDLSEKEFLKKSGWYKVWKSDFAYYRELLNFARQEKIPVIGLNADKKTVRLVVANEPDQLEQDVRDKIPELDMSDPYQRGMVEGIYGGHVKSKGMLEGFHRAQTLWDETMADSVINFLKEEKHKDFHMVVVAGGNHVRYGFGIPRRVFRRLPLSYTLIGGKEIEIPEDKQDRLMDVTLPLFPMPPYDFMAFLRYEDLDRTEVKLGVMLNDAKGKVTVKSVVPDSNAARAGIRQGDIILDIDNESTVDTFDVIYSIKQKTVGDYTTLRLERDQKIIQLTLELK